MSEGSGQIKMVGASVISGAGAYEQGIAEMRRVLAQVEGKVDALSGSWEGAPREAYRLLRDSWRASADELAKTGAEVSEKMTQSVNTMQQSEDNLEQLIRSLTR